MRLVRVEDSSDPNAIEVWTAECPAHGHFQLGPSKDTHPPNTLDPSPL